ncbi:MAG: tail fiber domain-containing protein, partial [Pedobacter agri]
LFTSLSLVDKGYVDSLSANGPFVNKYTNQIVRGLKTFRSDSGFVVIGTNGTGIIPASGAGSRMMYYPGKSAFRAGLVNGDQWNDAKVGANSTAFGNNTTASGGNSFAMGSETIASGFESLSGGLLTTSGGARSLSFGYQTSTLGDQTIALGTNTVANAQQSVAIGSFASTNGQYGSFALADGSGSTSSVLNAQIANQMVMRFAGGYRFYTSPNLSSYVDIAPGANGVSITSDRRKKENFATVDGEDFLSKIDSMQLSSWNYKGQDPKSFRHYGPMAQDFYHAFGKDSFGEIGNDTTISSADIDGVNMIAIQALIKRTAQLQSENKQLIERNNSLAKQLEDIRTEAKDNLNALNQILIKQQKEYAIQLNAIVELLQKNNGADTKVATFQTIENRTEYKLTGFASKK